MIKYSTIVFFLFCFVVNLLGSPTVVLYDDHPKIDLEHYELEYYEDNTNSLSLEDIQSIPELYEVKKVGESLNFGFTKATVWLHFKVRNKSSEDKEWLLVQSYPLIDEYEIFEELPDGSFKSRFFSDLVPFKERGNEDRMFTSPFSTLKNQTKSFYIRAHSSGSLRLPIAIREEKNYFQWQVYCELAYGVFFGILLVMAVYNLVIFSFTSQMSYLYYVITILSSTTFFATTSGHLFKFLLQGFPLTVNYLSPLSLIVWGMSTYLFAYKFLKLKNLLKNPKLVFWIIEAVYFICLLATIFVPYLYAIRLISFVLFINILGLVTLGVIERLRGNKSARFFLIAWSAYLFGSLFFIMMNYGILPSNFLTVNAPKFGALLEVVLLSIALIDQYRLTKKENETFKDEIIKIQKENTDSLEQKIKDHTQTLENQKEELTEKNKNITDSIMYANKIQNAILPTQQELKKYLKEFFVFYSPKDIVSGDFFWIYAVDDYVFVAVADCTGHGVPGALMSIVGHDNLNNIVIENGLRDPAKILTTLNVKIRQLLRQDNENSTTDGMDIIITRIDKKSKEMVYAGAMRPVYVVRDNVLKEGKTTRKPIGGTHEYSQVEFKSHSMQLKKHDKIYMFSDGYADQFGGNEGKKYMVANFKNFLCDIANLPLSEQKQKLEASLRQWQKQHDQVDDILVLGINVE